MKKIFKKCCETCNKEYIVFKSDYNKSKFCCRECYLKSHRQKPKKCRKCKKEFTSPGTPRQKYCSRECWRKGRAGQGFTPSYNKDSIAIIEEYGKKHGYKFQHAENGGEVFIAGFYVDAYDSEKNVVLEFMEKHHKVPKKRKLDSWRKKLILEETKGNYIEVWE